MNPNDTSNPLGTMLTAAQLAMLSPDVQQQLNNAMKTMLAEQAERVKKEMLFDQLAMNLTTQAEKLPTLARMAMNAAKLPPWVTMPYMMDINSDEHGVTIKFSGDGLTTYIVMFDGADLVFNAYLDLPMLAVDEYELERMAQTVANGMCPCLPDEESCKNHHLKNVSVEGGLISMALRSKKKEDSRPYFDGAWQRLLKFMKESEAMYKVIVSEMEAQQLESIDMSQLLELVQQLEQDQLLGEDHAAMQGIGCDNPDCMICGPLNQMLSDLGLLGDEDANLTDGCPDPDCPFCNSRSVPVEDFECLGCGGTNPDCLICGSKELSNEEKRARQEQALFDELENSDQEDISAGIPLFDELRDDIDQAELRRRHGMDQNPGPVGQEKPFGMCGSEKPDFVPSTSTAPANPTDPEDEPEATADPREPDGE